MHRLFVALSLPEVVADGLTMLQSGVEGARWRPPENFHLTLVFIGETDRHGLSNAVDALSSIDAPSFELRLSGVGFFGDRQPRALWASVERSAALEHLQSKVEQALRRAGFSIENRKYKPHVTLAYLKNVSPPVAAKFSAMHGLFSCGPFPVEEFHLYSSRLGGDASHYEIEASYSLSSSR